MPAFSLFKNVAIFGSADVSEDSDLFREVEQAAGLLAKSGVRVVNGGGPGLMLAATKGAKAAGGEVLTVSFRPQDAPFFEGRDGLNLANRDIEASNYPERVSLLMQNSDAFVIFKGGTGTFSEWAMVWLMAHIYYGHHKPFVLVGSFWRDMIQAVEKAFFLDEEEHLVYRVVDTIDQVIPALQALESHLTQLQQEDKSHQFIARPHGAAGSITPGEPAQPTPDRVQRAEEEESLRKQVHEHVQSFLKAA